MILMDCKAQTSLEYLLIIGGAILVGAIVLVILGSMAAEGQQTSNEATNEIGSATDYIKNMIHN